MKRHYCLAALLLTGAAQAQDDCRLDVSESLLDFGSIRRVIDRHPALNGCWVSGA